MKNFFILLILVFFPTIIFPRTTGIIKGVIRDETSLKPLPGVTIKILNTQIESTSDMDGKFIILDAPTGLCKLNLKYDEYHDLLIEQVRVTGNHITELNIEMELSKIGWEELQTLTAEPLLIQKDQTQKVDIYSAWEIQTLPFRDIKSIVSVSSATVNDEGDLYLHGGQPHETAFIIDGMVMNDHFFGNNRTIINTQSIEELQVQAGGMDAKYGNFMSGLVNITTKSGTPDYHFTLEAITDEFLPRDKKLLGAYSYAYNDYNINLSGPVIPTYDNLTFFSAFQRLYLGDRDPRQNWADGKTYMLADPFVKDSYLDTSGTRHYIRDTIGVTLDKNSKPGNWENQVNFIGKLNFHLSKNFNLNFSGIMSDGKLQDTYFEPGLVANMMVNSEHSPRIETTTRAYDFTFTHTISAYTAYDLRLNYYSSFREIGDGVFFNDVFAYGDPAKNPFLPLNYQTGGRVTGIPLTNTIARSWAGRGFLFNRYIKDDQTRKSIHFDLTSYLGKSLIKLGVEYNYHTLRYYELGAYPGVVGLASKLTAYQDAINADQISEAFAWYQLYDVSARVNYYGYDFRGNEVDEGDWFLNDPSKPESDPANASIFESGRPDGPKHPITAAAYIQDKVEFKNLIFNLGLRFDYFNPNDWQFKDIVNPINPGQDAPLRNIFDEGDLENSDTYTFLSPRIGFAFAALKKTIIHAHFGKYYQLPRFNELYASKNYVHFLIIDHFYYDYIGLPNLEPDRSTLYEIGIKQQIKNNLGFNFTVFNKKSENTQNQLWYYVNSTGFLPNKSESKVWGFDLRIILKKYRNLSISANYTLSFATGLGTNSPELANITWLQGDYPDVSNPLDHDQRHTGNINVDYRLGKGEGPVFGNIHPFENFGLNVYIKFNSGMPYTELRVISEPFWGGLTGNRPLSSINEMRAPANYNIDLKVDRTFNLSILNSRLNIYVWILNLFNFDNEVNVYPYTGDADTNGWLNSPDGQLWQQVATKSEIDLYQRRELNPFNYGIPRQIRLGIRLEI